MYKTYSMELAGRTLSVDIGRVGKQAGGCAFIHYADTTLLCTATTSAAHPDQPCHRQAHAAPVPQGLSQ